jgi:hypothetical protein
VSAEFDPGTVRVIRHCRVVAYVLARDYDGNWRVIAEGQEDEAEHYEEPCYPEPPEPQEPEP